MSIRRIKKKKFGKILKNVYIFVKDVYNIVTTPFWQRYTGVFRIRLPVSEGISIPQRERLR